MFINVYVKDVCFLVLGLLHDTLIIINHKYQYLLFLIFVADD